ncbi:hypothetical protein EMA8858_02738 [Emticicia aquatica]|uniref:TraB/GumN family protein n=1 Tax=Emticicia aquatica TaxID=1681835 RepID=A0ABN8EY80_9BACT|nr:TraB/GumN family protein [Emticicia aquatica]CAH0996606.1 hypothetical protein EMA8858_02738 [Emticicia aquatica]
MKNYVRFLSQLILILFPIAVFGQMITENALLWQISGRNLQKSSYLYGTIHAICPDDLKFSDATQKAFKATEQLLLELDLDDPELANKMQRSMASHTHLKKLLNAKDYEQLVSFFKEKTGFSIDALGMIKPFYLLSYTYSPMIGCNQPISVEKSLVEMAYKQNKSVFGLETLEEQLSVFEKISQKKQANMLLDFVKDFDKMQESFQIMLKEYKEENLNALVQTSLGTYAAQNEHLLLDKRNKRWIKKIAKMTTDKSTFFAVGAAHLLGENGIIHLLRKKGYTVTAVEKE